MPGSRLILIEGIPGAGKSTLAGALARRLAAGGRPTRWWYEEELGHPAYLFRDRATLRRVLAALAAGRHRQLTLAALRRWRAFVAARAASDEVTVLDGCLFGYLTWTLFHDDVPAAAIDAYLDDVAARLAPLAPRLIYLRRGDLATTLARIGRRGGPEALAGAIARATGSPHGRRRGLRGFAGLVAYWEEYARLTDAAYARLDWPRLALDQAAGGRAAVERAAAAWLGLAAAGTARERGLDRYVGRYEALTPADCPDCLVRRRGPRLTVDGLPATWPASPLIPLGDGRFAVEALPYVLHFEADVGGAVAGLTVAGPPLLDGDASGRYRRAP